MAVSEAQATEDHYATLGVTPRSEDVVIRAAYLALMRRYHPDKNSSSETSGRAQAIIAAFAVLGDVEKRLKYDWDRRRAAEELARPPQPRLTNMHRGLIAASLIALLTVPLAFMQAPRTVADPPARPPGKPRGPAHPQLSPAGSIPKPDPVERLTATVASMSAQKAAETVEPSAVAERVAAPRPSPEKAPRVLVRAPLERPQAPKVAKVAKPVASGISKCLATKPGADTAVCNNDNLAALDRLALAFYGQSLKAGNATKRAALLDSRNGFLGRLESCRSEPCLRSAYMTHMREISTIVEGKQPN